jgi:hypothetical protein
MATLPQTEQGQDGHDDDDQTDEIDDPIHVRSLQFVSLQFDVGTQVPKVAMQQKVLFRSIGRTRRLARFWCRLVQGAGTMPTTN